MAKSTKTEKQTKTISPNFQPMTVISMPSLVVDMNGVTWWVDPEHNAIIRAVPR